MQVWSTCEPRFFHLSVHVTVTRGVVEEKRRLCYYNLYPFPSIVVFQVVGG